MIVLHTELQQVFDESIKRYAYWMISSRADKSIFFRFVYSDLLELFLPVRERKERMKQIYV